jgi:modulator of FtsH protease HflK
MPYSNNGGPWGGGNKGGGRGPWGGGDRGGRGGGGGGGGGGPNPPVPDLDEIVRKGQEQIKILMGGGRGGRSGSGGGGFNRRTIGILVLVVIGIWLAMSFYTVRPEEQAVELTFGECRGDCIGEPGLNFAPWPIVTREIIPVTRENVEEIGASAGTVRGESAGLMLTGDENIVDIGFQVVWNVRDPAQFLFNLSDPRTTIQAVSESAMREIVSRSELSPILSRDRGIISQEVQDLIQSTLDDYGSGVHIVRVNFDKADPPQEVIDAFREVQAARQERSTLQNQADAYANRRLAEARGNAAQTLQEAEGYRAQNVNSALGEASRFNAVLEEYLKAPDVTRKRLYLESMERVLGDVEMFLVDAPNGGDGQGVVPYLPLNELRRQEAEPAAAVDQTGGSN